MGRAAPALAVAVLLLCACIATPQPLQQETGPVPASLETSSVTAAAQVPPPAQKPAFVEFFSTLCAVCRQMAPTVSRLEDEYQDRVDFLMYDSAGLDEATCQKYKYLAVPQFVIVGHDGRIVVMRLGYQTYETLKADIESVLAGQ